jgi:hypothetical protein
MMISVLKSFSQPKDIPWAHYQICPNFSTSGEEIRDYLFTGHRVLMIGVIKGGIKKYLYFFLKPL